MKRQMWVEKLPATISYENLELTLRIKKVENPNTPWRVRYITPRKREDTKDYVYGEMPYFQWKHDHSFYVTKLRSEGLTLEEAAKRMIQELVRLQKGERKLSIK